MTDIKKRLYQHCVEFIDKRITSAQEAMRIAQESANEETKSSAGDKYETGRAMAQLEMEKNATQLNEALNEKSVLNSISLDHISHTVQRGSLVTTDQGNFFIAISVGMVSLDAGKFGIVSAQSPIGSKMIGLKEGESFNFNNKTYSIKRLQ